ncbi:hypothetical protein GIB67_041519 [Kingdonia uniflora]|uniref:Heat shock protein 70 n=1 Tax=Kingdonia uniflora TaxID=39325 RepID=A0A7J7MQQ8_9MAGN|nr:hypothetical protein GIB67_041519 [Kingdonia uniflora]
MAELFVLRLMLEPIAMALLYGQHQQQSVHDNMGSRSENIAIIINMGVGYCDVCVSATTGGVLQIKALSGSHIEGNDIVHNIMHHLLPNMDSLFLSHTNNEMKAMGLLRVASQDAVIKLSSQDIVMIDVDLENGLRICKVLEWPEFEKVNRKVFEKCESLVEQCVFVVRVYVEDISDVILVGGCSNIAKVKSLVLVLCKKDEAYMGTLWKLWFAVLYWKEQWLLENMTMPARKKMWFTTTRDNQIEVLIVVYEGEGKKVDESRILGYFKIMGIPSAPKGIPEISVCMDLDASNVLRVYAGAVSPQTHQPGIPFLEVRMSTLDDGHGWCAEALVKMYGSTEALGNFKNIEGEGSYRLHHRVYNPSLTNRSWENPGDYIDVVLNSDEEWVNYVFTSQVKVGKKRLQEALDSLELAWGKEASLLSDNNKLKRDLEAINDAVEKRMVGQHINHEQVLKSMIAGKDKEKVDLKAHYQAQFDGECRVTVWVKEFIEDKEFDPNTLERLFIAKLPIAEDSLQMNEREVDVVVEGVGRGMETLVVEGIAAGVTTDMIADNARSRPSTVGAEGVDAAELVREEDAATPV